MTQLLEEVKTPTRPPITNEPPIPSEVVQESPRSMNQVSPETEPLRTPRHWKRVEDPDSTWTFLHLIPSHSTVTDSENRRTLNREAHDPCHLGSIVTGSGRFKTQGNRRSTVLLKCLFVTRTRFLHNREPVVGEEIEILLNNRLVEWVVCLCVASRPTSIFTPTKGSDPVGLDNPFPNNSTSSNSFRHYSPVF